jgi:hypothetical protein
MEIVKPEENVFIRTGQPGGSFCPVAKTAKGKATVYAISDGSDVENGEFLLEESVQVDDQFIYVSSGETDRFDLQMALDIADGKTGDYKIVPFSDVMEHICPTYTPDGP